jgi:cytochrome c-type biogenesis protein CcmH
LAAFWFISGMLAMLAVIVVTLPWLRTVARFESLPALPWQAPLLGLVVVGAALGMYAWLGRPELTAGAPAAGRQESIARPMSDAGAAGGKNAAAGSMNAAIASLRARLGKGGGSAGDWDLLAKSYEFLGRPEDARLARTHELPAADASAPEQGPAPAPAAAPLSPESLVSLGKAAQARARKQYAAAAKIYAQLAAAKQMNAEAWADYADTAGTLQNNKLAGEPELYIANALAMDPGNPKALWLKASADEEAGRYADAIAAWRSLQDVLSPDSQDAKIVAANLQRDRQAAGNDGSAASTGTTASNGALASNGATAPTGGASISGEVSLAVALSGKAALFIVAKSVDAPGPPVAVYRGSVAAWPVKFTLDDSLSMLPGRNLSNAKHVTVEARVSRSGQALPASGDLRGTTGVIEPSNHQPLKIVINEEVS